MKERMERFYTAFNNLHETMQEKSNSNADFFTLLKEMEEDSIISRYKDELHIIRKLRNLLVHEKKTINYEIAIPSEKTVEQLIFIREQLIQPATAEEYFSRKVFSFHMNDSLGHLLNLIGRKRLYQFPIFDKKGLAGIISHNGITNWLAHNFKNGKVDLSTVKVHDIIQDENTFYQYKVVPTNLSLFEVEKLFDDNLLAGKNQFILLLSNKQTIEKEKDLQGIITPWDLPRVLSLINY